MNVVVVHNAKSGSALDVAKLEKLFEDAGITVDEFIKIGDGFEQKLQPHIEAAASIVAIGGDGTISAVAGLVVGSAATLVPLPGGTLNNFTKDLGIVQDVPQAIERIATAKVTRIDTARVNDTVFVNNSSIGLYPASLQARKLFEDRIGKWPSAAIAIVRVLFRFRVYRVTIDDVEYETPFVFVGNNRYDLSDPGLTQRTDLNQGLLTVFVANTATRWGLVKIGWAALMGKVKDNEEFHEFHPSSLTINIHRQRISVSHDGEVTRLTPPLHYKVQPNSLSVRFAPATE